MMLNDLLNYDLKIFQNEDYFKFSIDSVLLAEFVQINLKCKNIMDLCTGNAPIPLILSKRFDGNIYGVEIQKSIFNMALESVKTNNLKNITLINKNAKEIITKYNNYFDIVTCNPPYFKVDEYSIINEVKEKAIARHELEITLEEIIHISSKILKNRGSLYLVYRPDRFIELINLLKKYNFGIRRLQFVYDNYDSECCFLLLQAKHNCKDDLKIMKPFYIDKYLEEK